MKPSEFNPDSNLYGFEMLSKEFLEKLAKYNIYTIGQLLGSTKGLSENLDIFNTPEEKDFLAKLIELIPGRVLDEYRDFLFRPPTGLIMNDKKEKNENTT